MLWFVCFFNYADRQAIFSVFELLKSEMNLTDVQLGVVGAAFMWVYAGFGTIAGLIGDRLKRKPLIIGGLVFWSLITIATALSTKYAHLVMFRALEGFAEAFYFPASMSLISSYHGPETRSRAMSIHQSSVYAGTIAGGSVAGLLGQHYGWRSSFYLFGSLGLLLGVVLLVLLREPVDELANERRVDTAFRTRAFQPTRFRNKNADRFVGQSDGANLDSCVHRRELCRDDLSDVDAVVSLSQIQSQSCDGRCQRDGLFADCVGAGRSDRRRACGQARSKNSRRKDGDSSDWTGAGCAVYLSCGMDDLSPDRHSSPCRVRLFQGTL
jgi:hypothetical protein